LFQVRDSEFGAQLHAVSRLYETFAELYAFQARRGEPPFIVHPRRKESTASHCAATGHELRAASSVPLLTEAAQHIPVLRDKIGRA
jgi:hypothetical protein